MLTLSCPFISDTSETENDFRLKSTPSAMTPVKQKMTSEWKVLLPEWYQWNRKWLQTETYSFYQWYQWNRKDFRLKGPPSAISVKQKMTSDWKVLLPHWYQWNRKWLQTEKYFRNDTSETKNDFRLKSTSAMIVKQKITSDWKVLLPQWYQWNRKWLQTEKYSFYQWYQRNRKWLQTEKYSFCLLPQIGAACLWAPRTRTSWCDCWRTRRTRRSCEPSSTCWTPGKTEVSVLEFISSILVHPRGVWSIQMSPRFEWHATFSQSAHEDETHHLFQPPVLSSRLEPFPSGELPLTKGARWRRSWAREREKNGPLNSFQHVSAATFLLLDHTPVGGAFFLLATRSLLSWLSTSDSWRTSVRVCCRETCLRYGLHTGHY